MYHSTCHCRHMAILCIHQLCNLCRTISRSSRLLGRSTVLPSKENLGFIKKRLVLLLCALHPSASGRQVSALSSWPTISGWGWLWFKIFGLRIWLRPPTFVPSAVSGRVVFLSCFRSVFFTATGIILAHLVLRPHPLYFV